MTRQSSSVTLGLHRLKVRDKTRRPSLYKVVTSATNSSSDDVHHEVRLRNIDGFLPRGCQRRWVRESDKFCQYQNGRFCNLWFLFFEDILPTFVGNQIKIIPRQFDNSIKQFVGFVTTSLHHHVWRSSSCCCQGIYHDSPALDVCRWSDGTELDS